MKIEILESFSGYPDGKKRVDYAKGAVVDVPDDFGSLIVSKGHAKSAESKAQKKES